MEQLSAAELLELIVLGEASIDVQFQLWLTSTFATIVASFAGRHLLTTKMRWVVTVLYLLATFVFASRAYYDAGNITLYREMLTQVGFENATPVATVVSRVALMLCGMLATVYFLHLDARNGGS